MLEQGFKGWNGIEVVGITGEGVDYGRDVRTGWSECGKRKQHF